MLTEKKFVSPELKNFDTNGYHYFGLWKSNRLTLSFWVFAFDNDAKELMKKLGLESKAFGVLDISPGHFYIKNSEIENIRQQIFKKIHSHDKAFFENMVKVADEAFTAAVAHSKIIGTKEPTAENFRKYVSIASKVNIIWCLGAEQLVDPVEEKIQEAVIAEHFPAEFVGDIIPKVDTPLLHQHHEVVELKRAINGRSLDEVRKDPVVYAKLAAHAEKYAWIEVLGFVGEPLTVERLYEQALYVKDEQIKTEIPVKPSDELAFRAQCMSHCGYLKQGGAEYFSILTEKAMPFLRAVASKIGLSYSELVTFQHQEILAALEGTISIKEIKSLAKKRLVENSFAAFDNDEGKLFCVTDPSDVALLQELMVPKVDTSSGEIKGQVGNKGTYTGPARIIMNMADFPKMQVGDVLVSTMTTPDFVILMQKAGAIVTDIGGMLCHAAIVSREINKPCVIGTKFATQKLKDGDIVEVDATKGIVRIVTK